ncbi:hypothetical protein GCM10010433_05520 [Streptomyces pulveraceus]
MRKQGGTKTGLVYAGAHFGGIAPICRSEKSGDTLTEPDRLFPWHVSGCHARNGQRRNCRAVPRELWDVKTRHVTDR